MSITIEKNQGVRLRLSSSTPTQLHQAREVGGYYKMRSYQGGGEFFEQENAQVILQCLGEFLPRATERPVADGGMEVFYQHLVNGQDVCGKSASVDSGVEVPATEITRLEAAIAKLKAKEADPSTDPTKKAMIRAFRLPSPKKDPELYRLYGSGKSRRLLVLWGVEKEAGSSLSPQVALTEVPKAKRSTPLWVWLLLALLFLGIVVWLRNRQRSIDAHLPNGLGNSPSSLASAVPSSPIQLGVGSVPGAGNSPGSSSAQNGGASGESPPQSPVSSEKFSPQPSPPGTATNPNSRADKSGGTNATTPLSPLLSAGDTQSSATMPTGSATTPNQTPQAPGVTLGDPKGDAAKVDSSSKASMTTSIVDVPANSSSTAVGKEANDTAASNKNTNITSKFPSKLPEDKAQKPEMAPTPRVVDATNNSSATSQDGKTRTGVDTLIPNKSPAGAIKASPDMSTGTIQPAAYTAEIVNARTAAVPRDGKVEMQLSLLARDGSGRAITIAKVNGWSVDGMPQTDASGEPVTSSALPVNLTEGKHNVKVSGVASDGRFVSAQAELNVDIAVREESSVRVKQLGKPDSP